MTDDEIMALAIHNVPGAKAMRADLIDFGHAILAASATAERNPAAYLVRCFSSEEIPWRWVDFEPMPEKRRASLSTEYRVEIVPLYE